MKKETILFFIILILFAGALILTGSPWFGIAVSMMLFYLVLAVLIVLLEGRKLNLKLKAEGETEKGKETKVQLEAENASAMPVARCEGTLHMQNLLTGAENFEPVRFGIFPKKKKSVLFETADLSCGMLQADARDIRLSDPLGLFSKKVKSVDVQAETLVMPHLQTANVSAEALEHYDMESFRYADGRVGTDSSETVGIREYREGDSIRAIHWKLSAKQGEPVVKEYGYPVETRLCVLADKCCAPAGGDSPRSDKKAGKAGANPNADWINKLDALSEFTLGVSLSLAVHDIPHTFGWYDRSEERFVCVDVTGRDDVLRLLSAFLSAPFYGIEQRSNAPDSKSQFTESGVQRKARENRASDTAIRFLESDAEKRYASYLYITDEKGKEDAGLSRLGAFGYVTVLTPEREEGTV